MDQYLYFKYTILLGATRALAHIGIHFTHRVFGLSLSLHLLETMDKLFQRRNQYVMLEDDTITATRRTVALNHGTIVATGGREAVMAMIDKASMSHKNRDTLVLEKRLRG